MSNIDPNLFGPLGTPPISCVGPTQASRGTNQTPLGTDRSDPTKPGTTPSTKTPSKPAPKLPGTLPPGPKPHNTPETAGPKKKTRKQVSKATQQGSNATQQGSKSTQQDSAATQQDSAATQQDSEATPQDSEATQAPAKPRKHRGPNWTTEEDIQLVKSWLDTGIDPIKGVDQPSETYWARIYKDYQTNRDFDTQNSEQKDYPRTQGSVSQRWSTIQAAVNKFCGAMKQAEVRKKTGYTQEDYKNEALQIYSACNQGKKFGFMHCWSILRTHQKWEDTLDDKNDIKDLDPSNKDIKCCELSDVEDVDLADTQADTKPKIGLTSKSSKKRPVGRDSAKASRKLQNNNDSSIDRLTEANMAMARASAKKAKIAEQAVSNARQAADDRIMLQSTSGLNDIQRRFLEMRQAEIFKSYEAKSKAEPGKVVDLEDSSSDKENWSEIDD